jgi:hypothetical protein
MLQQLISHSPDLKRLYDDGYEMDVNGSYLLVHHIPYLNSKMEILHGTLVCILTLAAPTRTGQPQDHTLYFCGEKPYNADGTDLSAIINNSNNQQLTPTILINHYFSSKPSTGNYPNYYDKIRTYTEILCSQARAFDSSVTAKPNQKNAA